MFYQVRPKQMDSWLAQFAGQAPLPLVLDVREPWECEVVRLPEDARFAQAFIPMGDIPARWQDAIAAATRDMIAELRAETSAGKLTPPV